MVQQNQTGSINILLIPLIFVSLLLCGAGAFAVWAYGGRQDYKNNVNKKITVAVKEAQQQTQLSDQAQFDQREKSPFKNYVGAAAFGTPTVVYPKTWSAYVVEKGGSNSVPIDGYMYPGFVPDISSQTSTFAFRIQVVQQSYNTVVSQYSGLVKLQKVAQTPYQLPKVPNVTGSRFEGEIFTNKQGTLVVMPLRNITIKIWTESKDFQNDFNTIILPNFIFTP